MSFCCVAIITSLIARWNGSWSCLQAQKDGTRAASDWRFYWPQTSRQKSSTCGTGTGHQYLGRWPEQASYQVRLVHFLPFQKIAVFCSKLLVADVLVNFTLYLTTSSTALSTVNRHFCFCRHEEKPKKIWQPPKAPVVEPEPPQPPKPPRTYEYTKIKSPQKATISNESTSDFMKRITPSKFNPAKKISPVKFSPSKATVEEKTPVKLSPAKISPLKAKGVTSTKDSKFFPSPNVVSSVTVQLGHNSSPSKAKPGESTGTDIDEPTKKPIAARFAAWEKKVDETRSQSVSPRKVMLLFGICTFPFCRCCVTLLLHMPLAVSVTDDEQWWNFQGSDSDSAVEAEEPRAAQRPVRCFNARSFEHVGAFPYGRVGEESGPIPEGKRGLCQISGGKLAEVAESDRLCFSKKANSFVFVSIVNFFGSSAFEV